MRYFLLCVAAFLLFALPAFAYDPPTDGVEQEVIICVDVQAYMEFTVDDEQVCFEIEFDDCEEGSYDEEELDYYICVNGDWYVLGKFVGNVAGQGQWDMDWDADTMWVYVNDILMTEDWSTDYVLYGEMGCFDSNLSYEDDIYPFDLEVEVDFIEKGDYEGLLTLELWDP